jgi:hypothetical protein
MMGAVAGRARTSEHENRQSPLSGSEGNALEIRWAMSEGWRPDLPLPRRGLERPTEAPPGDTVRV